MGNSPELVVLVDGGDSEIGIAEKLDAHQRGVLHRAFSVVVWDRAGRQLLQKRSAEKYHSGGLWTNACCGHPRPGEAVADAASRRLAEEMGLSCPLVALGTLTYRAEFANGLTEHELVHVFRGTYEGEVRPDPGEVECFVWCDGDVIERDAVDDPSRFTAWFREYLAAGWPMSRTGLAISRPSRHTDRCAQEDP